MTDPKSNPRQKQPHGVQGKPDPNFKPDPKVRHVYDPKKGVYRLVKDDR